MKNKTYFLIIVLINVELIFASQSTKSEDSKSKKLNLNAAVDRFKIAESPFNTPREQTKYLVPYFFDGTDQYVLLKKSIGYTIESSNKVNLGDYFIEKKEIDDFANATNDFFSIKNKDDLWLDLKKDVVDINIEGYQVYNIKEIGNNSEFPNEVRKEIKTCNKKVFFYPLLYQIDNKDVTILVKKQALDKSKNSEGVGQSIKILVPRNEQGIISGSKKNLIASMELMIKDLLDNKKEAIAKPESQDNEAQAAPPFERDESGMRSAESSYNVDEQVVVKFAPLLVSKDKSNLYFIQLINCSNIDLHHATSFYSFTIKDIKISAGPEYKLVKNNVNYLYNTLSNKNENDLQNIAAIKDHLPFINLFLEQYKNVQEDIDKSVREYELKKQEEAKKKSQARNEALVNEPVSERRISKDSNSTISTGLQSSLRELKAELNPEEAVHNVLPSEQRVRDEKIRSDRQQFIEIIKSKKKSELEAMNEANLAQAKTEKVGPELQKEGFKDYINQPNPEVSGGRKKQEGDGNLSSGGFPNQKPVQISDTVLPTDAKKENKDPKEKKIKTPKELEREKAQKKKERLSRLSKSLVVKRYNNSSNLLHFNVILSYLLEAWNNNKYADILLLEIKEPGNAKQIGDPSTTRPNLLNSEVVEKIYMKDLLDNALAILSEAGQVVLACRLEMVKDICKDICSEDEYKDLVENQIFSITNLYGIAESPQQGAKMQTNQPSQLDESKNKRVEQDASCCIHVNSIIYETFLLLVMHFSGKTEGQKKLFNDMFSAVQFCNKNLYISLPADRLPSNVNTSFILKDNKLIYDQIVLVDENKIKEWLKERIKKPSVQKSEEKKNEKKDDSQIVISPTVAAVFPQLVEGITQKNSPESKNKNPVLDIASKMIHSPNPDASIMSPVRIIVEKKEKSEPTLSAPAIINFLEESKPQDLTATNASTIQEPNPESVPENINLPDNKSSQYSPEILSGELQDKDKKPVEEPVKKEINDPEPTVLVVEAEKNKNDQNPEVSTGMQKELSVPTNIDQSSNNPSSENITLLEKKVSQSSPEIILSGELQDKDKKPVEEPVKEEIKNTEPTAPVVEAKEKKEDQNPTEGGDQQEEIGTTNQETNQELSNVPEVNLGNIILSSIKKFFTAIINAILSIPTLISSLF